MGAHALRLAPTLATLNLESVSSAGFQLIENVLEPRLDLTAANSEHGPTALRPHCSPHVSSTDRVHKCC